MDKKKIYIWVAILVLLTIGAYILYSRNKKKPTPEGGAEEPENDLPGNLVKNLIPTDSFPLKQGSRGRRVEQLQIFLSRKGAKFPKHGIDGSFKEETLGNVNAFLNVDEVSEEMFKKNRMTDFKTYKYPAPAKNLAKALKTVLTPI